MADGVGNPTGRGLSSLVQLSDNLAALAAIPDGSVPLIYIDPPFNTGGRQERVATRMDRAADGDRTGFGGERYRTTILGRATYDDLVRVPEQYVAEIVDGDLYASPRPAPRHSLAHTVLGADLVSAFHHGRTGPGGWWILFEPELHFTDDVVVPDIAGWRRTRMPELPETAYFELAPDWLAIGLSTDKPERFQGYHAERILLVIDEASGVVWVRKGTVVWQVQVSSVENPFGFSKAAARAALTTYALKQKQRVGTR